MKKIKWKIFNLALWAEVVLAYLLPFKVIDQFEYQAGFPIPFLSVYDTGAGGIGVNPFSSMHLNPLAFLLNGIILYALILFGIRIYQKLRKKLEK